MGSFEEGKPVNNFALQAWVSNFAQTRFCHRPQTPQHGGDGADVGVLAMSKSEQFREYEGGSGLGTSIQNRERAGDVDLSRANVDACGDVER